MGSLAGFLRISDHLVILWSPRYFTRLWCVYELACWMKLGKPLTNVVIIPVAEGSFMFWNYLGLLLYTGSIIFWLGRFGSSGELTYYYYSSAATGFMTGIMPLHIMRRNVRYLQQLTEQINEFDFEKARCFCCSVNHVLPGTKDSMPCDRVVI